MSKKEKQSSSFNPLQIGLIVALVIAAGTIGHLWTKLNQTTPKSQPEPQVKAQKDNAPTPPQFQEVDNLNPISDSDHIRGNPNAEIALIEYSDLLCPYCQKFHSTAKALLEEYGDQIMWVYRHYPLPQLHPTAKSLAVGSECAAQQGGDDAFWQFTDYIMDNNTKQPQDVAKALDLNLSQFNTCLESQDIIDLVETQTENGSQAGVTGTPGNILLNTKTDKALLVPGARPLEQLKSIIDNQLLSE